MSNLNTHIDYFHKCFILTLILNIFINVLSKNQDMNMNNHHLFWNKKRSTIKYITEQFRNYVDDKLRF